MKNKIIKIPYGKGFYKLNNENNFDLLKIEKIPKLENYEDKIEKGIK